MGTSSAIENDDVETRFHSAAFGVFYALRTVLAQLPFTPVTPNDSRDKNGSAYLPGYLT